MSIELFEHNKTAYESAVAMLAMLAETGKAGGNRQGWDEVYRCACEYYSEHGNLGVPRRYKTASGLSLGNWLDTQKGVRSGKIKCILTEDRIKKLDELGMRWESVSDMNWKRNFAAAAEYAEKYGELKP